MDIWQRIDWLHVALLALAVLLIFLLGLSQAQLMLPRYC